MHCAVSFLVFKKNHAKEERAGCFILMASSCYVAVSQCTFSVARPHAGMGRYVVYDCYIYLVKLIINIITVIMNF